MAYKDKDFLELLESKYCMKKDISFAKLVHFQTTDEIPFQRWYPYREGYSYRLVDSIIKRFKINGVLLDPFVGSGSSILAGRYNNLKTYGIDVNPLSIFITDIQNKSYQVDLADGIKEQLSKFTKLERDCKTYSHKFRLASKYFNAKVLQSLLQIKNYINLIDSMEIRNLFFLAWLSCIEEVSLVKKEGNGLKYRNRRRTDKGYIDIPVDVWEKENLPSDKFEYVKDKISQCVFKMISDIEESTLEAPSPILMLGSSTERIKEIPENIDLTIFSPPYVNFFDYFEIHKVELWLGDFISSQEAMRTLKRTGIRSNPSATYEKKLLHHNDSVQHVVSLIREGKLWSKKIPDVIEGYFDDMEILLTNIFLKTNFGGRVVIVVGNSAYNGTIVPTDLLIAEIAEKVGFNVQEIIIARHLTSSSQQRCLLSDVTKFLRESIIILEKEE